jgi:transposase
MLRTMKKIKALTSDEMKQLRHLIATTDNGILRRRCQCILYSYQGMQVNELVSMFQVDRRSIYNWMNRWNQGGFDALIDRPGRGLKPKLNVASHDHVEDVKQAFQMYQGNYYRTLEYINDRISKPVSHDTLRRFVKKLMVTGA